MSQSIQITPEDILHQAKISYQLPILIEGILARKIIISTATEAGITVEPEELQKAADNFRLLNKLITVEDTLNWLEKYNLLVDDFQEGIYINLLSGKLAEHLFGNQVEPWFYEHQLDYRGAAIYEVILDDEDLAMELFYELQDGETTFFEIAQEYIEDKELRRIGGYRGILQRQQMKPEISAKVFVATPPQVLKPIITSKGVHLIRVEELNEPELTNKLRFQIFSDLLTEWLKKQVDVAKVDITD
ncbi:peptidylprolyl isomerase [Planktothrix mougeotii]|uniref:peptidylprolyl isomerase n=1 Tax=Planktothrix mougeotii LEGE 06226 TaxID=1828728 RepID=A0ABR9UKB2_9CYAN|nr:peptidylprolyl isomerase [Planktothrix mougeotii]MBE9146591.1 peptidylprolyl isomerase [Planktothrix mougeotii LEGE 06226]